MTKAYPALFHYEDDGYWVEFPDLEGCFTQGDSIEETISFASEALGGYLFSMIKRQLPIPQPSSICDLNPQKPDFATIISVDMEAYMRSTRSVKKTLTIPEWLNEAAEARHINFSSVLQQALMHQLQ